MPLFSSSSQPPQPGVDDLAFITPPRSQPIGRIDIHSHLIPGVDDGCENRSQSLECIRQLQSVGYTGTICTPHVWPELFPDNTMPNIRQWTAQLQEHLQNAGFNYTLWPGGELRLFDGVTDWLEQNEPPTLAGTRVVLLDFWEPQWRDWLDAAFDWLFDHDYQPLLAHPERLALNDLPQRLDPLQARGVWLQGNFRCLTGEEGPRAERWVRQFLAEDRYDLLAMDMHRPDTLPARLAGLELARQMIGTENLDRKTIDVPRRAILHLAD